jgi:hypothetical protein
MGTSGSSGMFTINHGEETKAIIYEPKDAGAVKDELSNSEDGDVIVLGSPQLGMNELSYLTDLLEGRRFQKPCMIFCPRAVHSGATHIGVVDKLSKAGCTFICDSCSCLTPLISKEETDSVITNSIKAAYYLNHFNKIAVCLKDLKTIVKDYS